MEKTTLHVQKEFCAECSLALFRFLKHMKGIDSVDAGIGEIVITFDETIIEEETVRSIAAENIGKLGYRVIP